MRPIVATSLMYKTRWPTLHAKYFDGLHNFLEKRLTTLSKSVWVLNKFLARMRIVVDEWKEVRNSEGRELA